MLILSYSQETYHANGACQCEAYANGRPCWHRAAAQLVKRYREAEAAQAAAPAPPAEKPAATDERAALITAIQSAWQRARPFASLDSAVRQVFGVSCLEDVSTDDLRRVLDALTLSKAAYKPTATKPTTPQRSQSFIVVYRTAAEAGAPGARRQAHSASVLRVRPVSSLAV